MRKPTVLPSGRERHQLWVNATRTAGSMSEVVPKIVEVSLACIVALLKLGRIYAAGSGDRILKNLDAVQEALSRLTGEYVAQEIVKAVLCSELRLIGLIDGHYPFDISASSRGRTESLVAAASKLVALKPGVKIAVIGVGLT